MTFDALYSELQNSHMKWMFDNNSGIFNMSNMILQIMANYKLAYLEDIGHVVISDYLFGYAFGTCPNEQCIMPVQLNEKQQGVQLDGNEIVAIMNPLGYENLSKLKGRARYIYFMYISFSTNVMILQSILEQRSELIPNPRSYTYALAVTELILEKIVEKTNLCINDLQSLADQINTLYGNFDEINPPRDIIEMGYHILVVVITGMIKK